MDIAAELAKLIKVTDNTASEQDKLQKSGVKSAKFWRNRVVRLISKNSTEVKRLIEDKSLPTWFPDELLEIIRGERMPEPRPVRGRQRTRTLKRRTKLWMTPRRSP